MWSAVRRYTTVRDELRNLMRDSAQPVALVTTLLPPTAGSSKLVHGATLSSFSSISLAPPLLSFSIQTPSRLSDALEYYTHNSNPKAAHFVLNLLATHQAQLANQYAQPGLTPLSLGSPTDDHPLQAHKYQQMEETGGVPRLTDAVGAFACRIVDQIALSKYSTTTAKNTSVMYIAEVMHIYRNSTQPKPLLYYQHRFIQPGEDVNA